MSEIKTKEILPWVRERGLCFTNADRIWTASFIWSSSQGCTSVLTLWYLSLLTSHIPLQEREVIMVTDTISFVAIFLLCRASIAREYHQDRDWAGRALLGSSLKSLMKVKPALVLLLRRGIARWLIMFCGNIEFDILNAPCRLGKLSHCIAI